MKKLSTQNLGIDTPWLKKIKDIRKRSFLLQVKIMFQMSYFK